jgi:hypothetical protein
MLCTFARASFCWSGRFAECISSSGWIEVVTYFEYSGQSGGQTFHDVWYSADSRVNRKVIKIGSKPVYTQRLIWIKAMGRCSKCCKQSNRWLHHFFCFSAKSLCQYISQTHHSLFYPCLFRVLGLIIFLNDYSVNSLKKSLLLKQASCEDG